MQYCIILYNRSLNMEMEVTMTLLAGSFSLKAKTKFLEEMQRIQKESIEVPEYVCAANDGHLRYIFGSCFTPDTTIFVHSN